MILPDGILKTVVFVCYRDKKGEIRFAGTALFISQQDTDKNLTILYAVTALHVIASIKMYSGDGQVLLRINKKNGEAQYAEVHTSDWIAASAEEEFIDVAILREIPSLELFDVMSIPIDMFITQNLLDDELIGIGNEIIMIGLFVNYQGIRRNIPIVRYGNIAMLPEEPLKTKYGNMKGYLIESRSIGGLSGSPVFVYSDRNITTTTQTGSLSARRILLFGLIHGHYDIPMPVEDGLVEDTKQNEVVNMGIAIVVPAMKILEAINQNSRSSDE